MFEPIQNQLLKILIQNSVILNEYIINIFLLDKLLFLFSNVHSYYPLTFQLAFILCSSTIPRISLHALAVMTNITALFHLCAKPTPYVSWGSYIEMPSKSKPPATAAPLCTSDANTRGKVTNEINPCVKSTWHARKGFEDSLMLAIIPVEDIAGYNGR